MNKVFNITCPKCSAEFPLGESFTQALIGNAVEQRLIAERRELYDAAEKKALETFGSKVKVFERELAEKDAKLLKAQADELALRKERRTFEEQKRELELEVERRLHAEGDRIRRATVQQEEENFRLKLAEKDKVIGDMRKQVEELRRKSDQGSQQLQGEVLELALEERLKVSFPLDQIEPVQKGRAGADVIHRVLGPGGLTCGTILWETKRTKAWSDEWLIKNRQDQREVGAQVGVIISTSMPKGVDTFDQLETVFSDAAASGTSLLGRKGLEQLLTAVESASPPFDVVLLDDTSRLGRNLSDVLKLAETFEYSGVTLYFVNLAMDSNSPSFRMLHAFSGIIDEQYISGLREKVHRGQYGRATNGYLPGGKLYGYRNVPIEDPTRTGSHGRPAVIAVRQEILPSQAAIVQRIFRMYADGSSYADVAKALNAESIPTPQRPKKKTLSGWCPSAIREMLLNEKYRGVIVWNRKRKTRDPRTGRTRRRTRPSSEWLRKEAPHLRIIPEELWDRVREQNERVREKHGPKRLGGMNRTVHSRSYLFSGLLECGLCGANITVICGKAPNVRYGCPSHRFRGTCNNRIVIARLKLEKQLLACLALNLQDPALASIRAHEFHRQLNLRLAQEHKEVNSQSSQIDEYLKEQIRLRTEASNLISAVAMHGYSVGIGERIKQAEERLRELESLVIPKAKAAEREFSKGDIEAFLQESSYRFAALLEKDVQLAKQQLRRHVGKLVLTPRQTETGFVLQVSGDVALFSTTSSMVEAETAGIMREVARVNISGEVQL
jgi:site-specific DNA recombinase